MTAAQLAFLVLIFLTIAGMAYALMSYFNQPADARRLEAVVSAAPMASPLAGASGWLKGALGPLAKLSVPEQGWESSPLRVRFLNAGLRGPHAPVVYFAAKTALTFVIPGAFALYVVFGGLEMQARMLTLVLLFLAAMGYYLPNVVLARLVAHRQRELFEVVPDALDLMRVCVEAGLGLDASIARVGDELRLQSAALYEELHLVSLELRAGASRERALRNLALRMGLEDIDGLVAMLVQADRFGTSISESLRVHADGLRVKRRLMAEEAAAKIPVKMLFPLIFCILPALFVVLLGPAVIGMIRILLPKVTGQ
ncbi:MAG: type II secretion system protein [Betaproteobacteria bacterium RIFCSPLOWO2_12_FULL_67_28]|nr:MAG: type II secretion system protein [Betaproteobacteria bacterium RIFCSPLOWO2_12_FULL_67_28]